MSNAFCRLIFCQNKKMKKFPFFYQNNGLTPLEKSWFFDFSNFLILEPKNCWLILPIIKKMEKFQIFDQNHWLTPLEKSCFCEFFNFLILESNSTFFHCRTSSNTFLLADFANDKKDWKLSIFLPKPYPNPFGKVLILRLFELSDFRVLKMLFFFLEHRQTHCAGWFC